MVGEMKREVVFRQLAILIVAYFLSKKFLKLNTLLSIVVSVLAMYSTNYLIGTALYRLNRPDIPTPTQ